MAEKNPLRLLAYLLAGRRIDDRLPIVDTDPNPQQLARLAKKQRDKP